MKDDREFIRRMESKPAHADYSTPRPRMDGYRLAVDVLFALLLILLLVVCGLVFWVNWLLPHWG